MPLKTYLPDGDIDLTAFGGANVEDTLADKMISVLEEEERNTAAEFIVKDVQLIRAEVACLFLLVNKYTRRTCIELVGSIFRYCICICSLPPFATFSIISAFTAH